MKHLKLFNESLDMSIEIEDFFNHLEQEYDINILSRIVVSYDYIEQGFTRIDRVELISNRPKGVLDVTKDIKTAIYRLQNMTDYEPVHLWFRGSDQKPTTIWGNFEMGISYSDIDDPSKFKFIRMDRDVSDPLRRSEYIKPANPNLMMVGSVYVYIGKK